jgi:glycosyltransferase involved in cell wall biosynthesis
MAAPQQGEKRRLAAMPVRGSSDLRVAVIVPCYRDGELVARAVASVQEEEPVELVVVDDGSPDDATRAVLEALPDDVVRVVRHDSNQGLIAARMTGLAETHAPYLFPLDADDLAAPGVLARMADMLDRDPGAAVCFGDYVEFGSQNVVRAVPQTIDPYRLSYTNEYPVSALFRRSALEAVGGWGSGGFAEAPYADWNLWIALAELGARGVHLGEGLITFHKRFHEGRMLDTARRRHREMYRGLKRAHPRLFGLVGENRRKSDLSLPRKLLYPVVYGGRPRLPFERAVKLFLDRLGVWTLRR